MVKREKRGREQDEEANSKMLPDDLNTLKVSELKNALKSRSLETTGKKSQLIVRLHEFIQAEKGEEEEKKRKVEETPSMPPENFSFFEGMIDGFLIELATRVPNLLAFTSTCKRMHDLLRNNTCATRIIRQYSFNLIVNNNFYAKHYHESRLAGNILHNYKHYLHNINKNLHCVNELPSGTSLLNFLHISDMEHEEEWTEKGFQELAEQANLYKQTMSSIFSSSIAKILSSLHRTPIFNIYSRLFSYTIAQKFPIIQNVHSCLYLFTPRSLYPMELALFDQVSPAATAPPPATLIHSFDTFKANMNKLFLMDVWHNYIDWDQYLLVGGSVLRNLLVESFDPKDLQDVDFFWLSKDYYAYNKSVDLFVESMRQLVGDLNVKEEGFSYVRSVTVHFPFNMQPQTTDEIEEIKEEAHKILDTPKKEKKDLQGKKEKAQLQEGQFTKVIFQFIWYDDEMRPGEILTIFDLDCCQVGYNGKNVVSTFAFANSVATKTMINYKLINSKLDLMTFIIRTKKYMKRGFTLLVPKKFDKILLDQDYPTEPPSKEESIKGTDYSGFLLNNDSLEVREHFVKLLQQN